MNPSEQEKNNLERLLTLSLQAAGDCFPTDIEDVLDDEASDVELPENLIDSDAIVKAVFSKNEIAQVLPFPETEDETSQEVQEMAKAARHGVKLSKKSLRIIEEDGEEES